MDKHRLETFSDGVFAVVAVLLVLDLRPLAGVDAATMIHLASLRILVYVLSFAMVGCYWVAHHRMLHFVGSVSRTLLWTNLALLMSMAFLPYPAALIGATQGAPVAIRLYGATLMLTSALGTMLWLYGTGRLHGTGEAHWLYRRRMAWIHMTPVLVYATGIVLAAHIRAWTLLLYAMVPACTILGGMLVDRIARVDAPDDELAHPPQDETG